MPKLACLWPGLPQLWMRGAWSGLALAVGFTVLVNLAVAASLVWTEWLSAGLLSACWGAVLALWLAAAGVSLRGAGDDAERKVSAEEDLFREAQAHYLRGNWIEAETMLTRLIGRDARDVDARLMLATLKRHTNRLDEAEDELRRLVRLEDAGKWQQEIESERVQIAGARNEQLLDGAPVDELPSLAARGGGEATPSGLPDAA